METIRKQRKQLLFVMQTAIIAALYVVLTLLSNAVGLASGVIQVRISEALCTLVLFTPAAIPGMWIGCMLANLVTGALWQDILFGSLASLIGAGVAYLLRKAPFWIAPIPTVLANMLIVPWVLRLAYGIEDAVWYMMLTVGAGEVIAAGVLGIGLYFAVRPIAPRLFGPTYTGRPPKPKKEIPEGTAEPADPEGPKDSE
ncbi:MAG: QueT transporter family protein [Clostridia bacterium]|nr:QueT transporter family protein [Clostridia bacterium]